jgi:hypothetical protein
VSLSTSDFGGGGTRLQSFGYEKPPAEERERGGYSRLSPIKSRLFAKQRITLCKIARLMAGCLFSSHQGGPAAYCFIAKPTENAMKCFKLKHVRLATSRASSGSTRNQNKCSC